MVAVVYVRLFEAIPEAASLFKGDLQDQQRRFANMLQSIVKLTRSSHLWPVTALAGQASIPTLDSLGSRHAAAGVTAQHFAIMKSVFSKYFEETAPNEFTPDVQEAFGFIFDVFARSLAKSGEGPAAILDRKNEPPGESSQAAHNLRNYFYDTSGSAAEHETAPPARD